MLRSNRGACRVATVVAGLVAVVAGCGTSGLALRTSGAVRDLRPPSLATVHPPVTISWGGNALQPGQRYLLLVDRKPMAAGRPLLDLLGATCATTPGCPDDAYLRARLLYLTTDHQLALPTVPSSGSIGTDDHTHVHRAVIVVLDGAGRRAGEQSWSTDFVVPVP
jgi:hypothetical protein